MKKIIDVIRKNSLGPLSIHEFMLLSSGFSIILLAGRIIIAGEITYAFLVWNLFLAWIPYFISNKLSSKLSSKIKFAVLIFLWLIFMPNSFYIITDLFHLNLFSGHHQWFDLTLILSFAWNGILFGIISLRRMEIILISSKGKFISSIIICFVIWLSSFGIYIGRFLRFNSWDVIANPFSLFNEIFSMVSDPYEHRWVWAMTICFSVFIMIVYYSVKKLNEPFQKIAE